MNVFQRQRIAQLKRVVFTPQTGDEDQHTDGLSMPGRSPGEHRQRWTFDPGTAVLLSVGIIVFSILMVWAASASPQHSAQPPSVLTEGSGSASHGDSPPSSRHTPQSADMTNPARDASSTKGHKLSDSHMSSSSNRRQNPRPPGGTSQGDEAAAVPIVVHVAGAVHRPGIVELSAGARVHQAITAAGGMRDDAATEANNLAAYISDGDFLYVPTRDEVLHGINVGAQGPANRATAGQEASGSRANGGGAARIGRGAQADACIDINHADAQTLEALPGVGPALSARIVEYRNANGPFARVEDLDSVPGIGIRMINTLRAQVCP